MSKLITPGTSQILDTLARYATVFLGALVILMILAIIIVVFFYVGLAKIFKKAGYPMWTAIIPIYNIYLFVVKICKIHWAWFVAMIITSLVLPATVSFMEFVARIYPTMASLSGVAITLNPIVKVISTVTIAFVFAMSYYNLGKLCNRDAIKTMIFGALIPVAETIIVGFENSEYDESIYVLPSGLF